MRVRLVAVGALLIVAAVVVGSVLFFRSGTVVSADVTTRMRACLASQGSSTLQNDKTVACLSDAMFDAASNREFDQVLDLRAELMGTPANASCHAAGHDAGLRMIAEFDMAEAIDRMFDGPEEGADQVCVAAMVHGLVAGKTTGIPPFNLEYVAEQCLRLEEANPVYTYECAHFFGHAVWRTIGQLDDELASLCGLLGVGGRVPIQRACMAGAVMQKFDLQTKHYDPTNEEAKRRIPPTRGEMESLCDGYVNSEQVAFDGCMGALGWLAAVSASDMFPYEDTSSPAWVERAVEVYTDLIGLCDGNYECHINFANHFRVEAYTNGVAAEVCRRGNVDVNACQAIIDRYTPQ